MHRHEVPLYGPGHAPKLQIKRQGDSIHQNLGTEQDIISGSIELYLAIDWILAVHGTISEGSKEDVEEDHDLLSPSCC